MHISYVAWPDIRGLVVHDGSGHITQKPTEPGSLVLELRFNRAEAHAAALAEILPRLRSAVELALTDSPDLHYYRQELERLVDARHLVEKLARELARIELDKSEAMAGPVSTEKHISHIQALSSKIDQLRQRVEAAQQVVAELGDEADAYADASRTVESLFSGAELRLANEYHNRAKEAEARLQDCSPDAVGEQVAALVMALAATGVIDAYRRRYELSQLLLELREAAIGPAPARAEPAMASA